MWSDSRHLASAMVSDYVFHERHREDATQEALLGLWEATLSWREGVHSAFEQYAWYVMRRRLFSYLTERADDKPRLTRKERDVFNTLRQHLRQGQLISSAMLSALAIETGISTFRLQQIVVYWYASQCAITAHVIEFQEELSMEDEFTDYGAQQDALLDQAMAALPERERLIIAYRYLEDPRWTLARLAEKLEISIERVRVIEGNALRKMRTNIENS